MQMFDFLQIYAKTILTHPYTNIHKYYEKILNIRSIQNTLFLHYFWSMKLTYLET